MKLILFLVAVYSLIFHQYNKIEKSKIFPSSLKQIYKNRLLDQAEAPQPENYVNADKLVRGRYLIYRHSPYFQPVAFLRSY